MRLTVQEEIDRLHSLEATFVNAQGEGSRAQEWYRTRVQASLQGRETLKLAQQQEANAKGEHYR